mgnify:CR=1 FL=1
MTGWCNKHFPNGSDQTSCWDCVAENSPCGHLELESICTHIRNCRDSSLLDVLDPPTGELKICLEKLQSGDCCSESQQETTKGMSKRQQQYYWESRVDKRKL